MPVYGRPQRTRRAIRYVLNQSFQNWEAFIIGDGPDQVPTAELTDKRIRSFNLSHNKGGFGYWITNYSIHFALGEYFMFMANDDRILPNHFENYLSEIEGTDYDFVYFDYLCMNHFTKTKLRFGHVGDNAVIIRTDFLKRMPLRSPEYGHDFKLIRDMMKAGAKYKKSDNLPTYQIMSHAGWREDLDGLD